jgi:hypothetical protein
MPNPKVSYSISACPGITNKLISILYSTLAPTAEIARIVDSSSHASPVNQEFDNLNTGTYLVRIFQSTDGTTLGTLQHDFWIDTSSAQSALELVFFQVDGGGANDPVGGASSYINTYLNGKTVVSVFQEGFRFLRVGIEYSLHTGGGIDLIGNVFGSGSVWSVAVTYPVQTASPTIDDTFGDVVAVTGNLTITSAHYNKSLFCNSSSNTQLLSAPVLSGVPDGKGFLVVHDGGNQINVKFKANGSEAIRFRGADVNYILLAKGEWIKIIKKGTKWYVIEKDGQWDRIGERIGRDLVVSNSLALDGSQYDGTVYLRLADYVNSLPNTQVVDYTTFDTTATINGESVFTKRGFFATSGSMIKVPDMRNLSVRFVKNIGGTDTTRIDNLAGGYQGWQIGEHFHTANETDASVLFVKRKSGGPGGGFGLNNAGGGFELAERNSGKVNVGLENNVRNIAQIPLLLI